MTISFEVMMDFFTAKRIFDASLSMDAALGQIDTVIGEITDEAEKDIWVSRLGCVMRSINEELINPTLKLYPKLDNSDTS